MQLVMVITETAISTYGGFFYELGYLYMSTLLLTVA
jgi:hypothetical protein